MAVDWEGERRRRGAEIVRIEQELYQGFQSVIETTMAYIEPRVLGGGRPDPRGAFAAQGTFGKQADEWIETELRPVAEAPLAEVEHVIPASTRLIENYLEGARNRLVNVPDRVYDLVKEIVQEGVTSGTPNDELVDQLEKLFSAEGVEMWEGRLMTIVRTESIAAQNAGQFASFLSLAALDPDTDWEKAWLSTEDIRTRETHVKADQQRPAEGDLQGRQGQPCVPG
jgi:hypothetical protein